MLITRNIHFVLIAIVETKRYFGFIFKGIIPWERLENIAHTHSSSLIDEHLGTNISCHLKILLFSTLKTMIPALHGLIFCLVSISEAYSCFYFDFQNEKTSRFGS